MVLTLAAALTLKTVSGATETVFPAKDRRATVVFVVLAECPIVRGYAPEMTRLSREYGKKGVRFVMAFADGKPAEWRKQMREFSLPFTAAKADARLIDLVKAETAPTAALIGPNGSIPYVGRIDDRYPTLGVQRTPRRRDLALALDAFLAGKKPAAARTAVVGCALPGRS